MQYRSFYKTSLYIVMQLVALRQVHTTMLMPLILIDLMIVRVR